MRRWERVASEGRLVNDRKIEAERVRRAGTEGEERRRAREEDARATAMCCCIACLRGMSRHKAASHAVSARFMVQIARNSAAMVQQLGFDEPLWMQVS